MGTKKAEKFLGNRILAATNNKEFLSVLREGDDGKVNIVSVYINPNFTEEKLPPFNSGMEIKLVNVRADCKPKDLLRTRRKFVHPWEVLKYVAEHADEQWNSPVITLWQDAQGVIWLFSVHGKQDYVRLTLDYCRDKCVFTTHCRKATQRMVA